MLEHQKPVDSPRQGRGSGFADEPELAEAGFLLLQSASDSSLQEALLGEIAIDLPAPQGTCVRGDYTLLWLAPGEYLLEHPVHETPSLQSALTRRLATSLAVAIDMSEAFACFEVRGARAAETLMSGCSLDLRTHAFPAGRVARTALADVPAVIWSTGKPHCLRCLVDRSFAAHLRDWLMDVARGQGTGSRTVVLK